MVKRIPIAQLQPGMRTARMEESAWLNEPGLYTGTPVVLSRGEINRLMAEGYREACILVDDESTLEPELETLSPVDHGEVEHLLAMARATYLEALKVASRVVMDVTQGKPVNVQVSRETVRTMLESVDADRDALACVARLTPVGAYLGSHMVNVTAMSLAFGRSMGLRESELVPLGLAAFLHDIGMTQLPLTVLSGADLLSGAEVRGIKKHPQFGERLLRKAGGLPKKVRDAVVQHHENHDGSGYPEGLAGREIGGWARIIHLADIYDGLTRDSCRGSARPPAHALSHMYSMAGAQFESEDLEWFVRCVSVYPAGSLVRLSTDETALVLRTSRTTPTAPLVKVVLDAHGKALAPRIVDVSTAGIAVREPVDSPLRMAEIATLAFAS